MLGTSSAGPRESFRAGKLHDDRDIDCQVMPICTMADGKDCFLSLWPKLKRIDSTPPDQQILHQSRLMVICHAKLLAFCGILTKYSICQIGSVCILHYHPNSRL